MILERLRFLYGDDVGGETAEKLDRLLSRVRERLPAAPPTRDRFDHRDAILITYGDTFNQDGLTPLTALRDFAERHLEGLVSGIHLLPFFPYSSDYGFAVVDYRRVNPALGSWDDIHALHSEFKLMFDLVLNHVSVKHEWFQGFLRGEPPFDQFFITLEPDADLATVIRPRTSPLLTRFDTANGPRWVWTTFSADQVDLDYGNPDVLLHVIDVMLGYVEHGADLLRLDAVGFLWKEVGTPSVHLPQTHEVVKLLRDVLDDVSPHVAIVTETNVPHEDNVSYFGDGGDEAQMVYQFPLATLVLDALARGDASRLARWAVTLSTPSHTTTFFNFLASHDGVGVVPATGIIPDRDIAKLATRVRAGGGEVSYKRNEDGSESIYELNATYFDALADPDDDPEDWETRRDRFLCSQAILLVLAGVPGVYVHSLFGSRNDRAGYERSGWKRDLNHERLDLNALESKLADPSSETAQVFYGVSRLLRTRCSNAALDPASPQRVLRFSTAVFALRRGPWDGEALLALHNVTAERQVVEGDLSGVDSVDLLTGRRLAAGESLSLEPYEVLWLVPADAAGGVPSVD